MKVNFINIYSVNQGPINKAKQEKSPLAYSNGPISQMPIGYMPHQVHFGITNYSKLPQIKALKTLKDLPCLYCGKKMVQQKAYETLEYMDGTPSDYAKKAITTIGTYEDTLQPVEKKVFQIIKDFHQKNPKAALQEIMHALRPEHLENLTKQQINIMNSISDIAQDLPEGTKQNVLLLTSDMRNQIVENNVVNPFKRKIFIEHLDAISNMSTEKNTFSKIREFALSLPSSGNSVDAFIVKYSGSTKADYDTNLSKIINENSLSEKEKEIFDKILSEHKLEAAKKTPQEILDSIYSESSKNMAKSQSWAIEEVKINAKEISATLNEDALSIINKTKAMVENPSIRPSEAKRFLQSQLNNLKDGLNKSVFETLQEMANKMPDSENDINAFIVEHSNKLGITPENKFKTLDVITENDIAMLKKIKDYFEKSEGSGSWLDKIKASYPHCCENVTIAQKNILNHLLNKVKFASSTFENSILKITKDYEYKSITEQKEIISNLRGLNIQLSKDGYEYLTEPITKIPTSQNSIDAFVVEYGNDANADKLKLAVRSDKEIAQRLLVESLMSVDHIKPKDPKIGGSNSIENLGMAHQHCNNARSNQELSSFAQGFENAQEQMDFIIENINNGTLKGCDTYPKIFKETLFKESAGKIKLDISKLKILNTPELDLVNSH